MRGNLIRLDWREDECGIIWRGAVLTSQKAWSFDRPDARSAGRCPARGQHSILRLKNTLLGR